MAIPADVRQWEVRTPGAADEHAPALFVPRTEPVSPSSHAPVALRVRGRTGSPAAIERARPGSSSAVERVRPGPPSRRPGIIVIGTPLATAVSVEAPGARPISRRRRRHPHAEALLARARSLWPGLAPRQLSGTRGDPRRIVRLVARRSNEAPEVLLEMLLAEELAGSR